MPMQDNITGLPPLLAEQDAVRLRLGQDAAEAGGGVAERDFSGAVHAPGFAERAIDAEAGLGESGDAGGDEFAAAFALGHVDGGFGEAAAVAEIHAHRVGFYGGAELGACTGAEGLEVAA